jgi:hypothetical protein
MDGDSCVENVQPPEKDSKRSLRLGPGRRNDHGAGLVIPPGVPPGIRSALLVVLVLPASLLALAVGLLWLLGLLCGESKRKYITAVTREARGTIVGLFHGARPPAVKP